jgi:hypothetical protein
MGLYNIVFKTSAHAPLVLAILGRPPSAFGRFRDAWIEKDEAGVVRLAVYTRNGGGNREDNMPSFEDDPHYLFDRDDDFDSTYATIYFKPPVELPAELRESLPADLKAPGAWEAKLVEIAQPVVDMSARWKEAIASLKA